MSNYIGGANAYKNIAKMHIEKSPFEENKSVSISNPSNRVSWFEELISEEKPIFQKVDGAEKASNNFITGRTNDLISVVSEVNAATIEVKKAIPIFREIIRAYKEIMQLPL